MKHAIMQRELLACAVMAGFVLSTPAAHTGLIENVYHNIPATAFTPTDASIALTQANAASVNPNYTFINSAVTFNYTSTSTQTNTLPGGYGRTWVTTV